jgi:hypothetical protein
LAFIDLEHQIAVSIVVAALIKKLFRDHFQVDGNPKRHDFDVGAINLLIVEAEELLGHIPHFGIIVG